MTLEKAEDIAKRLMIKYDLEVKGWVFRFDHAKKRLGYCRYKQKVISLSVHFIPMLDENEITDTVLHEIAHVMCGKKNGHNQVWRQKAIELGCNGQRLYHGEAHVKPIYKGTCPKCGRVILRHKRKKISCSKCDNVFRKELMFVWTLNE